MNIWIDRETVQYVIIMVEMYYSLVILIIISKVLQDVGLVKTTL